MRGNPAHDYRPVIVRVLEFLRSRADANGELFTSNREIGRQVGCSIGGLPTVMHYLEADGVIARTAAGKSGTHIRLLTEAPAWYGLREAAAEAQPAAPAPRTATKQETTTHRTTKRTPVDLVSQIERAAQLMDRGLLTDEQFEALKRKVLEPS